MPTARVMALLGADVVWVDWEHAAMGVETMTTVSYYFPSLCLSCIFF